MRVVGQTPPTPSKVAETPPSFSVETMMGELPRARMRGPGSSRLRVMRSS
jgi:hypothetical protein